MNSDKDTRQSFIVTGNCSDTELALCLDYIQAEILMNELREWIESDNSNGWRFFYKFGKLMQTK